MVLPYPGSASCFKCERQSAPKNASDLLGRRLVSPMPALSSTLDTTATHPSWATDRVAHFFSFVLICFVSPTPAPHPRNHMRECRTRLGVPGRREPDMKLSARHCRRAWEASRPLVALFPCLMCLLIFSTLFFCLLSAPASSRLPYI